MLLAALASVVIASCYDGDTCTTTTGERVRLACIDTPELSGKRAEPVAASAARDHLRGLVVGEGVGSDGSPKIASDERWQSFSLERGTFRKRWSVPVTLRFIRDTRINVRGLRGGNGT